MWSYRVPVHLKGLQAKTGGGERCDEIVEPGMTRLQQLKHRACDVAQREICFASAEVFA